MTLSQLIAEIDQVKPNAYDKETMTRWVSEVEGMAIEKVLNHEKYQDYDFEKYDYDLDQETELMIPDRFADVYIYYVSSKIDYANREFGGYNNSKTMFDGAWDEFAAYWKREYPQKRKPKMRYF